LVLCFRRCCLLTRRAPTSTLFPYTTLFRSGRFKAVEFAVFVHLMRHPVTARPHDHHGDAQPGADDSGIGEVRQTDGNRVDPKNRSEEHTSELQSRENLVCRLLLEKKKKKKN